MSNGKNKDSFWSQIGAIAVNNFRWQAVSVAWGAFAFLIILVEGYVIVSLSSHNTELSKNRVMFGFADDEGVFISTEKRPDKIVARYARDYVNNMKNFEPDIEMLEKNSRFVISMMNPEKKVLAAKQIRSRNQNIIAKEMQQSFIIDLESQTLEETKSGYIYRASGYQKQSIGTLPLKDGTGWRNVEVELTKVPPTTARQEGLWVESAKGV